jgi:very-short-patch-repair endonuclease
MPSLDLKVVGVTFHPVIFDTISSKSKVDLSHDTKNPHDANAVKVVIDGKQVGYISKNDNITVLNKLKSNEIAEVKVKKVTGGGSLNNGIVIRIVFNSVYNSQKGESDAGKYVGGIKPYISYISDKIHNNKIDQRELFIGFLRHVKLIGSRPLFGVAEYENKIDSLSYLNHSKQYRDYLQIRLEDSILPLYQINDWNNNQDSGKYVTIYENVLYSRLRDTFPTCRQAFFSRHPIDIVSFYVHTKRLWAIEVDGGIHQYSHTKTNDDRINNLLLNSGISVIRVSNHAIQESADYVFDRIRAQILETF